MSSILWKSFNLCFSKFNCLPTVKFADHESLYFQKSLASTPTPTSVVEDFFSSSSATGDSDTDYIPNFASVFASQRFFISTPGSSNSIFEPMNVEVPGTFLSGGVAVQKYSPDPYAEFHKSMQEMMEAHELMDGESSTWEFLHELLWCYLTLSTLIGLLLMLPPTSSCPSLPRREPAGKHIPGSISLHHRQLLQRFLSSYAMYLDGEDS